MGPRTAAFLIGALVAGVTGGAAPEGLACTAELDRATRPALHEQPPTRPNDDRAAPERLEVDEKPFPGRSNPDEFYRPSRRERTERSERIV